MNIYSPKPEIIQAAKEEERRARGALGRKEVRGSTSSFGYRGNATFRDRFSLPGAEWRNA
jgi:hypothetical protein